MARPSPHPRMGRREIFPQQPRPRVRGLDREGRLRLRRHRLVDLDRRRGLQRRRPARLCRRQRRPEHPIPRRPDQPGALYSGDFRGDGEAPSSSRPTTRATGSTPGARRRDLGAAIPSILRRFPRNDAYARATLGEILGDGAWLARPGRFAATELRSGVFLSQPDGTYRFEPLPRIAQISPLQGMVAGDFDGDRPTPTSTPSRIPTRPSPSVGRFDGGLSQLLRGRRAGHFDAVPPGRERAGRARRRQGPRRPRPGRGRLARTSLVSRNNDTTLAFRNRPPGGLRPPCASPCRAGGQPDRRRGRITVAFSDGTTQTSEVCAGSGYYSQSTPACFFGHPESRLPQTVRVRWPSGPLVDYPVPTGVRTLAVAMPADSARP